MESLNIAGIGLALAGLGLAFWLVTRLLLRTVPRIKPSTSQVEAGSADSDSSQPDAILTIQPGGRVLSLNQRARQIFNLSEKDQPDLERLARQIRPSEPFLDLCASEGQERFTLEGRQYSGSSYRLSIPQPVMVLALRPLETSGVLSDDGSTTTQTLRTITELSQAMAASLELETTVAGILESIARIIPADYLEITVWDSESEWLIPYRKIGTSVSKKRIEPSPERFRLGQGYSGFIARDRVPLMIADINERTDIHQAVSRNNFPIRAYLGVPLVVTKELIGTLELGSLTPGTFKQDDLDFINLLSGQAAVAIHNAMLYREERRRSRELSGLAQLSQAMSLVREPTSIFDKLVQSIVPLMPVDILGFLIYNESTRVLEGKKPFHGLPDPFVEGMYRVPVPSGSALEISFLEQDLIMSEDATEDDKWKNLGLDSMAVTAGLRDSVLVPLTSGGRMMGYLQASNHRDGATIFTQDELRLLLIIANQAASMIENSNLVQQSRQRAQRAEGLRRIASLASSAANLDEILKFSLQELVRLVRADFGYFLLSNVGRGELVLHEPSVSIGDQKIPENVLALPMDDPQYPFTITGGQRALNVPNLDEEQAIIPFYQQFLKPWQVKSLVAVPLVIRDHAIGELWFCSKKESEFDQGDLQAAVTAAGQLAGVVEQNMLSAQTDESLRRRVDMLTSLSRITRELNTSLDLKALLGIIYDDALQVTGADCGTIMLFDPSHSKDEIPSIRLYVGDTPAEALSQVELLVLTTHQPSKISEPRGHAFSHEGVGSALLVPLLYQMRTAGLIVLHSKKTDWFDQTAVEITQSLSAQASIALGNALQYEDQTRRGELLKRQFETVANLFRITQSASSGQSLEETLQNIAKGIQEATPFKAIVFSMVEPASGILQRVHAAGVSPEAWDELRSRTQPWSAIQHLIKPEFKIGSLYFIPADQQPVIPEEMHSVVLLPTTEKNAPDLWDADDFLLIPLYNTEHEPIGMISVDDPRDGRRPDRPTLEALELFGTQASLMVENHLHLTAMEARLRESGSGSTVDLPLHMERLQAGMEIAEVAAHQTDPQVLLREVARELIRRFNMSYALVVENTPSGPHLVDKVGDLPAKMNPEALFGQRNPLRQVFASGHSLLSADIVSSQEWLDSPLLSSLEAKSFLALPIRRSEDRSSAILVTGKEALPVFSREDERVVDQLVRQVSIGIQNLDLLAETRRHLTEVDLMLQFSRKLGSLDADEILGSLISSALEVIEAADAGWVGILDRTKNTLTPRASRGYPKGDSLQDICMNYDPGISQTDDLPLPLRSALSARTLRVAEVNFVKDYSLSQDDLLHYRNAVAGRLPVSSLVVPIRLTGDAEGVLVLDNFSTAGSFNEEDESLVASLTQQSALGLENARLFRGAGQRASQLQALTQVAATLTSSLQSSDLLGSLLGLLHSVLPYQTATLWLREDDQLHIAAAEGFEDSQSRLGITAQVKDSALFQEMVVSGQAIMVPDIRQDVRFSTLIEPDRLSWLGIPLVAKSQLVGLIALEKTEANGYSPEDVQIGMTFAGQAAVALDNARLFEESNQRATELDQRSERLALLNRLSGDLAASLDVDYILKLSLQQLLDALKLDRAAGILVDEQNQFVLQTEVPPSLEKLPLVLPELSLLRRLRESQGIFYTNDVTTDPEAAPLMPVYLEQRGARSLLIVPLIAGSNFHGWILLMAEDTYRFSTPEIELARTISNQAAIAIQNARLFAETRRLTADLERRVEERTAELTQEHRNSQTLLRIITELSNSLDLDQVLNRALTVLVESIGVDQAIIVLSQSPMVYSAGEAITTITKENQSSPEREIARWVTKNREPALVDDISADARWNFASESMPAFKSVIGVPLVVGEDVLGSLILFQRRPAFFVLEQINLFEATARQIAIALNNAELFGLIRDQAERLGAMLREQQIEASRSRAILEAVADGVLVTDAQNRFTLFNASAEKILNLRSEEVMGKPLDQFIGLFGSASRLWAQTIRNWSQDPNSYQTVDVFSEQLDLDNNKVVSVHLAPVYWRSQFLGTVSTFRDITHEVQLDRLKSEFVANVSHELRTPMTSIKGYVEIMLMGASGELSQQQRHFLSIVKENTDRLTVLVNDLLDIARTEAGRVHLKFQLLRMEELVADAIEDMRSRSQEENKPITFIQQAPKDLPDVMGDLERIRQILGNLLSNGYNYTPAGGEVIVSIQALEDQMQVDVKDNGVGIDPAVQHRIFDRFYRGEDPLVLATSGFGLGLSLSKNLIEMHGGKIWFTSSGIPGEGSVFSFTIPLTQPEE